MKDLSPELTALAHLLRANVQPAAVGDAYTYVEHFEVQSNGKPVHVSARRGSKGAFMGAEFWVLLPAVVTLGEIVLRAESALDRIGSKLQINREFQVGDPAFDRGVYIESDAPDATLARLLDATVRELTLRVVTRRGLQVVLRAPALGPNGESQPTGQTRLEVFAPAKSLGDHALMYAIPSILEELSRAVYAAHERSLAGTHSPTPYGRGAAPLDPSTERPLKTRTWRGLLVAGLLAANWAVGILSEPPPTATATIIGPIIACTLLVYVAYFALFALLLRGRSTSLRNTLIATFVLFFSPFISGAAVAKEINARFATGSPTLENGIARVRYGSKGSRWVEVLVQERSYTLPRGSQQRLGLEGERVVYVEVATGALGGVFLQRVDELRFTR
ncbi:MAG: hypothetical protein JNK05_06320 [Myxococcales bacterium]|nr:hypothetical protein [Myxococcales bacterium]